MINYRDLTTDEFKEIVMEGMTEDEREQYEKECLNSAYNKRPQIGPSLASIKFKSNAQFENVYVIKEPDTEKYDGWITVLNIEWDKNDPEIGTAIIRDSIFELEKIEKNYKYLESPEGIQLNILEFNWIRKKMPDPGWNETWPSPWKPRIKNIDE